MNDLKSYLFLAALETTVGLVQHSIQNIGQKVLNVNDITFNKRLGNLISRSFEVPYIFYCQPLAKVEKNMESNNLYHHFLKYLFLGLGIIMLITSTLSWFFPELFWVNGEKMEQSVVTTLVFGMIGIVCFPIFIAIKDKFVIVKLGGQNVTVKNGENERKINWMEVESLSLIQFVYPPLYKLKVKGDNKVYWFNTENQFINAGGFTSDTSEMGDLIKKKKRELGI